MSAGIVQVFEYLLALKNMTAPIIRDFREYREQYWWQQELPLGNGCWLTPNTKVPEAWLEVHKQELEAPPALPEELEGWAIRPWDNPAQLPQVQDMLQQGEEKVAFSADPQRVAAWEEWRDNEWQPWAQQMQLRLKIQNLYNELFTVYQRLQREGDNFELAWGHGLLAWRTGDTQICRPLFVTKLELQFDAESGIFTLIPVSSGTNIEMDMLGQLNLPNMAQLVYMERVTQEVGINAWDFNAGQQFFKAFVQALAPGGFSDTQLSGGQDVIIDAAPVIYHAPVIFMRGMLGRQWHNELQGIIEEIRGGRKVPETINALVSLDVVQQRDEEWERDRLEWEAINQEILFPLPANEEQRDIIAKLRKNIGVVVQGPPGTGKSHTIVNMIAHLLAHGKKVLVTSQTERALRVLGEMISSKLPEIAPLCVSVMGGDSRSVEELEIAVTQIADGLDQANSDILASDILKIRQNLADCQEKIQKLKLELGKANETENMTMTFADQEFTPLELAEWLLENQEEYSWLPDELNENARLTLSDNELMLLYQTLQEVNKNEVAQVLQHRPIVENLPAIDEIISLGTRLAELAVQNIESEALIKGWTFSNKANSRAHKAIKVIEQAAAGIKLFQDEWLLRILDDIVYGDGRVSYWQRLMIDCKAKIRSIREVEHRLLEHSFLIPENLDLRQVKQDADVLKAELLQNGKPSMIFRMFTGKKTLYLFDQVLINGSRLQTANDLILLTHYIGMVESRMRLALKWNHSISIVNGPQLHESDLNMLQTLEGYMALIQQTLNWKMEHLTALMEVAEDSCPWGSPRWTNIEWLDKFVQGIVAYAQLFEYNLLQQEFEINASFLKRGMLAENAHSSWRELYEAYRTGDGERWQQIVMNLSRLHFIEPKVYEMLEVKNRVSSVAPRFMAQIEDTVHTSPPPSNWRMAWEWRRADTWLRRHTGKIRLEKLYEQLNFARQEERRLVQTLVSKATWLEQNKRTTEAQKRSLRSWTQIIRKIGKGTGKYAAKHQADAKKEMAVCRSAVPVWIMPLNRVIENFMPGEEAFDVVIVDESSQSDLFALCALFRGKRAIIVGDDRQISPEAVGRDQGEVHNLIDRYLFNVPQRGRFTLQDSLYDTALRVFPGQQIMLKEHFRCVPEIIQFSNEQFYGGTIEPLRMPGEERLLPPVAAVYVEDGQRTEGSSAVNEPEALMLTEKVLELCSDPAYSGKTMGVISLQGKEQAYFIEQLLREKLGAQEMVKRHIVCGDAYSFQGDERDVIFLSMVVAPNMRSGVLNKITDEQRFNVAASRAREQMWLFHSMTLEELQENCMRYRLLNYCRQPAQVKKQEIKAETLFARFGSSLFKQELYQLIRERGYKVAVEYKVGTHAYRIPLVVESGSQRLAIECDGDGWQGLEQWADELERQHILERVGWKFWRIRGSQFYRNKEKALEPLWKMLKSMGIEPQ